MAETYNPIDKQSNYGWYFRDSDGKLVVMYDTTIVASLDANDFTLVQALVATSLAASAAVTVGTTLGVTGLSNLDGGIAVDTNKFTMSAAGAGIVAVSLDVPLVTNAALILESLGPLTVKLNDTDALQFDNAAIAGFAAAADTAGNSVYIETEDGGVDTAVDGGSAGGLLSIKTGDASAGGADQAGAAGGAITLTGGAGSAAGAHSATNPAGGAGAAITVTSGAGGAGGSGGSGNGGAGGAITHRAGAGGASGAGGTGTPGAGGDAAIIAGAAGAAAADTDGAAGGSANVTATNGSAGGAHTANDPNGGAGGDVTLTAGAGGAAGAAGAGVAGAPGKVAIGAGVFAQKVQTIDMGDAAVTLTLVPGTPTGTLVTGNLLFVDPNSGGANENLLMPHEADCAGMVFHILNTGGEGIAVQNDAGGAIVTVATTKSAIIACDGTAWYVSSLVA